MAPAPKPIIRSLLALVALSASASVFAAEMNYTKELGQLSGKIDITEVEVGEVRQDVIERRGFIGAAEASARAPESPPGGGGRGGGAQVA